MAAEGLKHYLKEPPLLQLTLANMLAYQRRTCYLKNKNITKQNKKQNKTKQKTKQNQNPQAILEVIDS